MCRQYVFLIQTCLFLSFVYTLTQNHRDSWGNNKQHLISRRHFSSAQTIHLLYNWNSDVDILSRGPWKEVSQWVERLRIPWPRPWLSEPHTGGLWPVEASEQSPDSEGARISVHGRPGGRPWRRRGLSIQVQFATCSSPAQGLARVRRRNQSGHSANRVCAGGAGRCWARILSSRIWWSVGPVA